MGADFEFVIILLFNTVNFFFELITHYYVITYHRLFNHFTLYVYLHVNKMNKSFINKYNFYFINNVGTWNKIIIMQFNNL